MRNMKLILKRVCWGVVGLIGIGLIYYVLVARIPEDHLSQDEIVAKYQYFKGFHDFKVTSRAKMMREFSFKSFDGEKVYGKVVFPNTNQESFPVLVGIHAMGRSYPRWFQSSLKGRPTVTHVDKITQAALQKGFAVIAIDARFHGKRKVKEKPLRSIWNDLHFFGNKSDYENMIINTVIDNRLLIDWIVEQPEFNSEEIHLAGYSMGGQVSLILAAIDGRVEDVVSIVPPFISNSVASVSPLNLASLINDNRVLMIVGAYDDVASPEENRLVFDKIATTQKQLITYQADHILPEEYVDQVARWLSPF
ncbi:alpha/beta fold hydrolase [Aliikangiella marina]|uniref:Alpha/beta fold hydrolase n=1 Tax=Aliikangiella marina TaxID=1712262 RepID=A0A545TIR6_9GAMM|nr:alpha/beta fold hydrolase [Aliikangiella marina]TQV77124.1 alpha/beta fold hydrolase [Aliikangiella marina]